MYLLENQPINDLGAYLAALMHFLANGKTYLKLIIHIFFIFFLHSGSENWNLFCFVGFCGNPNM